MPRRPSDGLDALLRPFWSAGYQAKLSCPFPDCFDLTIDVPAVAAARTIQRECLAERDAKGKQVTIEADLSAGLLADRALNWSKMTLSLASRDSAINSKYRRILA